MTRPCQPGDSHPPIPSRDHGHALHSGRFHPTPTVCYFISFPKPHLCKAYRPLVHVTFLHAPYTVHSVRSYDPSWVYWVGQVSGHLLPPFLCCDCWIPKLYPNAVYCWVWCQYSTRVLSTWAYDGLKYSNVRNTLLYPIHPCNLYTQCAGLDIDRPYALSTSPLYLASTVGHKPKPTHEITTPWTTD